MFDEVAEAVMIISEVNYHVGIQVVSFIKRKYKKESAWNLKS